MENTPGPRAGRKEWTALGVLMLPLFLVSMDVSVLYFAIPYVSQDLEPSATQQLWILDMYGFVLAGLLITMGALGDRIGRRRLVLVGASVFGAASVLAAYAHSAELLIAVRALLGLGGAALMPSTLALIRNLFHDGKQRGRAVTLWTAVMTTGISVGPVVSGLLLEHFWWGSVFLINLPAMVLLLALVPFLVPEFTLPKRGRFDLLSAVLSLAALLPVIYGIKELARHGYEPLPALGISLGLVLGFVFVRRQKRLAHPLIDLGLLGRRTFGGPVFANLLAMFATVGMAVFLTQYLQSVLGMSPFEAALWSLVPAAGVAVMAPAAAALAQRTDRAFVMGGGFLISACGFLWLTQVRTDSALWITLAGVSVYAGGLVAAMTLGNELALGAAPPEGAGSAAAVLESGQELGGALGMAILGSIGAAVYSRDMADALPADVPHADSVRETLGGATAEAAQLPAGTADTVLAAARDAFTHGMGFAAVGAAVVMAGAGLFSLVLLGGTGKAKRPTKPSVEPKPAALV
ncbi:MFS transporter [Streptomyces lunaelactis]|uniref:MFS transporter n=1 Tax=Streptomyces lunaelactis TaxID=1535768 RepID=UPI001585004E|nr:MFS transporter [Streptomyces lunaelactis]NUK10365.1 MFS transporter [Streptomyces lunaelactis]NUK39056.1 MFS transporter [Streptomyces lunaelactis]NUK44909.1 MFS transporter [Streptomyces lunaelactis]NUK62274.1 MFS transporter [Streptomyces lunaelactis]NUK73845.1 MFS transporter [Streptomyces lunaelactis]